MVVEVKCDGHPNPRIEGEQVLHAVHVGLVIILNGQALAAVLTEPREVPAQQSEQGLTQDGHCEACMCRASLRQTAFLSSIESASAGKLWSGPRLFAIPAGARNRTACLCCVPVRSIGLGQVVVIRCAEGSSCMSY